MTWSPTAGNLGWLSRPTWDRDPRSTTPTGNSLPRWANPDPRVPPDHKGLPELRGRQEPLAQLALRGRKGLRDRLDRLGRRGQPVLADHKDRWVPWDQLD